MSNNGKARATLDFSGTIRDGATTVLIAPGDVYVYLEYIDDDRDPTVDKLAVYLRNPADGGTPLTPAQLAYRVAGIINADGHFTAAASGARVTVWQLLPGVAGNILLPADPYGPPTTGFSGALADAAGAIALPKQHLANTLADCPAFQAMVGVGDEVTDPAARRAAAASMIYFEAMPAPADPVNSYTRAESEALRPCATVWVDPADGFHLDLQGGANRFSEGGKLLLRLDWMATEAQWADEQVLFRTAENLFGVLFYEMVDRSGGADFLAIRSLRLTAFDRVHDKQVQADGHLVMATVAIGWSTGNGGGQ